ncbi:MFS transporter [Candidatus Saccharibacteria bacterium]|nr:MFS transporter [Candidatus Saccharibacteria bacterium]
MACYALTALGFLLFTTITSIWYLAAVQAGLGLVRAFAEPAFDALYSANLDKNREAQGWAAWEAMAYFVTAFGSVAGAAIVSAFSFDTLFTVMAIMSVVSALYLFSVPKSRFQQTLDGRH